MSFDSSTENASLIAAGTALADPIIVHGGIPFVTVPDGYRVHDLENLLYQPARKRAGVSLHDRLSFAQYVQQHKTDSTTLYSAVDFDRCTVSIQAVIDDHGTSAPKWRDHTASFAPKLSHEWEVWLLSNRRELTQSKFAEFIEENLADIASVEGKPTAAQMLEMALQFEATSDKSFKRKIDLQAGGVTLEFVDKADAETTSKMSLFKGFMVGIPVFDGSTDAYPIEARLKYRQRESSLVFWYELVRTDRVFRTAVTAEFDAIKSATGLDILRGSANLR